MLSCLAPVTSLRQFTFPRRRNTPRNAKIKASLKSISSGSTSENLHAQWCLMRDIKKMFFAPPPVTNIVFSCRDGARPVSTGALFTTVEICNAICSQTVCNLSSRRTFELVQNWQNICFKPFRAQGFWWLFGEKI